MKKFTAFTLALMFTLGVVVTAQAEVRPDWCWRDYCYCEEFGREPGSFQAQRGAFRRNGRANMPGQFRRAECPWFLAE